MFIPIKAAMALTGMTDKTIRDWVEAGKVPAEKNEVSGILHVDKEKLLQSLPTSICFYNQKGGVGKTSLTVMLTDYFQLRGLRVLIVDLDPQGNCSQTFFDYEDIRESMTLYNYMEDRTPLQKCVKKYNDSVDVLCSDLRLSRKDNLDLDDLSQLVPDFVSLFKKYNIILIDCPPSLSCLSKFGLLLSNYAFLPVVPEPYSYDGMLETINNLKRISKFNDEFIDFMVLINAHEQRKLSLHENYIEAIRNDKKIHSFEQTIPTSVAVKERGVRKENIFGNAHATKDKGLKRIYDLFDEVYDFIYLKRGDK